MKITKAQAKKNRAAVREYWHSYLRDGHIMAWLFTNADGDVWMEAEPQGQTIKVCRGSTKIVHEFGDFYRAHGELPDHITLKDFTAELGIDEYLK